MKKSIKFCLHAVLILMVVSSCSKNDTEEIDGDITEFPSFGNMQAIVNGEQIVFSADKAKKYAFNFLTIYGRSCSKRMGIRFDIPFAQGTYTLESLGYTSVVVNAASACPGESGSVQPLIIQQAEVFVTEFSDIRVKGTFTMTVGDPELPQIFVTNGTFNIERE